MVHYQLTEINSDFSVNCFTKSSISLHLMKLFDYLKNIDRSYALFEKFHTRLTN
ncbi:uncharacterized protein ASCRUDRAFT_134646 [Ascoidea rubescens DSM 1968]|uniref:Uncharacterized protein n=1 Tax=Ascoidea rubescens DSM 1968 TaxID=1344418 RepID=A0A1D2VLD9_9ASCO|nr:hypothetical protein ASCRUDRAFT_134646 [Ascoidea rubescens DSM 1968]ODV62394.1 hypothetical protein ASCRUDRAFT_134646 [Ascoidea rubescens DSM 1968]